MLLNVKHSFKVPTGFSPPFKPNVCETYSARGEFFPAKEGLYKLKSEIPFFIEVLLETRNKIVGKLGFKSTFTDTGDFGPFEVTFKSDDFGIIQFNDPNFSFYGEIRTSKEDITGYFAVGFHNMRGRIYFYSIFPGHYIIFKYLLRKMSR